MKECTFRTSIPVVFDPPRRASPALLVEGFRRKEQRLSARVYSYPQEGVLSIARAHGIRLRPRPNDRL